MASHSPSTSRPRNRNDENNNNNDDDTTQQPLLAPSSSSLPSSATPQQQRRRRRRTCRRRLQEFLSSRTQHFCVLALVSLDLLGIFADIFIDLYVCQEGEPSEALGEVRSGLGVAGLVFSCLFMFELAMSIWAFGWRYFTSYFHTFDAIVIVTGFVVDVLLHGVLEEIASLVVVLRLWRFFKIVEEFSVGAQEQMDALELRIHALEARNRELRRRIGGADGGSGGVDGNDEDEETLVGSRRLE